MAFCVLCFRVLRSRTKNYEFRFESRFVVVSWARFDPHSVDMSHVICNVLVLRFELVGASNFNFIKVKCYASQSDDRFSVLNINPSHAI